MGPAPLYGLLPGHLRRASADRRPRRRLHRVRHRDLRRRDHLHPRCERDHRKLPDDPRPRCALYREGGRPLHGRPLLRSHERHLQGTRQHGRGLQPGGRFARLRQANGSVRPHHGGVHPEAQAGEPLHPLGQRVPLLRDVRRHDPHLRRRACRRPGLRSERHHVHCRRQPVRPDQLDLRADADRRRLFLMGPPARGASHRPPEMRGYYLGSLPVH